MYPKSGYPLPSDRKIYAGIRTHGDIDAIAGAGFMYRGERERLHAAPASASRYTLRFAAIRTPGPDEGTMNFESR